MLTAEALRAEISTTANNPGIQALAQYGGRLILFPAPVAAHTRDPVLQQFYESAMRERRAAVSMQALVQKWPRMRLEES